MTTVITVIPYVPPLVSLPPEITAFTLDSISGEDVSFDLTVSEACDVDWVMTVSATAPTPAQVAAGTDNSDVAATASGTFSVAASGVITSADVLPADLDATYAFHLSAHDGSGNRSLDVDSVTGVTVDTTGAGTTPVTVTPIGSAPTVMDATVSPMTGNFTRTEAGAGIFVIAGFNFRGSATDGLSAVDYGSTTGLTFDVAYGTDTDSYVAVAHDAALPTGLNALDVTFGGSAPLNNHGAQMFELPDGGTVGTAVSDEIAGAGTLSVDLPALPAGAGVLVVAYGQNMDGNFVITGATETADLALGSNRMTAAYVSNLGSATDPLTITAVNSDADSTDIGLLMAVPILPA